MGSEGWKVRQQHFETVTALVRASRAFFPEGAAAEIWLEFRNTFLLSASDKLQIWQTIEKLLVDNQVEVWEHAAGVLASLMKGIDKDLSKDMRDKSYAQDQQLQSQVTLPGVSRSENRIRCRYHYGAVLALTASVLSVPYDMPSWLPGHVTLLACFLRELFPVKSTLTKALAEFKRMLT